MACLPGGLPFCSHHQARAHLCPGLGAQGVLGSEQPAPAASALEARGAAHVVARLATPNPNPEAETLQVAPRTSPGATCALRHVLRVDDEELFPADLLCLYSALPDNS